MRRILLFLLAATNLAAAPTGGVEARAEQGRLVSVSSWWNPSPDWQARWWWRDGLGSVWVKAGGFQMGPLIVTSGGDGWRRWYPGTTLSSGYWGLAYDGGPWGLWTVQRPDTLETGAQVGASDGSSSVALGADRTWSLQPSRPGAIPWSDRVRAGATYDDGPLLAGAEATALVPASGPRGWNAKLHAAYDGDLYAGGRVEDGQEPGQDTEWTASSVVGWESLSLRWTQVQNHDPKYEARWADDARWWGVTWGADFEVSRSRRWEVQGGVSAAGRWDRARWTATWAGSPADTGLAETVTATWKESLLEVETRWHVERPSLGWFGPGSEMTLTVRRLF